MSIKQRRLSYTIELKLKVIEYAKVYGNRAAERQFGPTESQIRWWRKQESELLKRDKRKHNLRGKAARWPLIEEMVKNWVLEHGKNGFPVTPNMVLFAARRVAFLHGLTDFVGTISWCHRFMRRHGFDRFRLSAVDQNVSSESGPSSSEPPKFIIDGRSLRGSFPKNDVVEANELIEDNIAPTISNSDCGSSDEEVVVIEIKQEQS